MRRLEAIGGVDRGLRRACVRRRWRDETNFLLRTHNAKRLLASIAELDRWAALLDRPRERAHDDAA
jgi:hypothetical protein